MLRKWPRAHFEPARGTDEQNDAYCTKEGEETVLRIEAPSTGTSEAGGGSKLHGLVSLVCFLTTHSAPNGLYLGQVVSLVDTITHVI